MILTNLETDLGYWKGALRRVTTITLTQVGDTVGCEHSVDQNRGITTDFSAPYSSRQCGELGMPYIAVGVPAVRWSIYEE